MSTETIPKKSLSLVLNNPGIDPNLWHKDHKKYDSLGSVFLLLNTIAGFGLIILASGFLPKEPEWLVFLLGVALLVTPFVAAWKTEDKYIERLKNDYRIRTESYRREKAPLIIARLNEAGFTVNDHNGPNYLAWGDHPDVWDKDGNKYKTRNFYISQYEIILYLDLADRSEKSLKNTAEILIENYEKEHGLLSDREKEIFIHAVQIGGTNAIKSIERY